MAVVVYTFHPSIHRERQEDLCEIKANLVYTVSSKITEKFCLKKTKTEIQMSED